MAGSPDYHWSSALVLGCWSGHCWSGGVCHPS